jgi:hypothetical protein
MQYIGTVAVALPVLEQGADNALRLGFRQRIGKGITRALGIRVVSVQAGPVLGARASKAQPRRVELIGNGCAAVVDHDQRRPSRKRATRARVSGMANRAPLPASSIS